jgi:hypothetical protein
MIRALPIFSLSSSTRSLLAETNEISMPEKKAINKSVSVRKNISMCNANIVRLGYGRFFILFVLFHLFQKDTLPPDVHIYQYTEKATDIWGIDMIAQLPQHSEIIRTHDKSYDDRRQPCFL